MAGGTVFLASLAATVALLVLVSLGGQASAQSTFYIEANTTTTGDCTNSSTPCGSFEDALSLAFRPLAGVDFVFGPGVHYLSAEQIISRANDIALLGTTEDPTETVLACKPGSSHRAFYFTLLNGMTVANITLENCTLPLGDGGFFFVEDSYDLAFSNVVLRNNEATAGTGGALNALVVDRITLLDVTAEGNTAAIGGAFGMDGVADTVVSNLRLIDNTATSFGGGMRMRICSIQFFNLFATGNAARSGAVFSTIRNSRLTLVNVFAFQNIASESGGFGTSEDSAVNIYSAVFSFNSGTIAAGVLYFNGGSTSVMNDVVFDNNDAVSGAVFEFRESAAATLSNVFLISNVASTGGVAFLGQTASVTITNALLDSNVADTDGGCFFTTGTSSLTLANVTVQNSITEFNGGVISATLFAAATVTDSQFLRNRAEAGFGGVFSGDQRSSWTITRCNFEFNRAQSGGAVFFGSSSFGSMVDVTFNRNSAEENGGALAFEEEVECTVSRAEIHDSSAVDGGCVFAEGTSDLTFSNVHLYQCIAQLGGALYSERGASLDVVNSVIESSNANQGGCFHVLETFATFTNVTFQRCAAGELGGAFYGSALPTVTGGVVHLCTARRGAGFYFSDFPIVEDDLAKAARVPSNFSTAPEPPYTLPPSTMASATLDPMSSMTVAPALRPALAIYGETSVFNYVRFANNTASEAGAAIYWEDFVPATTNQCTNCTFIGSIVGGYGPDFATDAALLIWIDGPTITASGDSFDVLIDVTDYYGQHITANGTFPNVFVEGEALGDAAMTGSTRVQVRQGTASFDNILVNAPEAGDFAMRFFSIPRTMDLIRPLTVLDCDPGFQKNINQGFVTCTECPAGRYEIAGEGVCGECEDGAVCKGTTQIWAAFDYWRNEPYEHLEDGTRRSNRTTFHKCARNTCCGDPSGCPLDSQCAANRIGLLCGECEGDFEVWGGECVDCKHTSTWLLVVPFFLSLFVPAYCLWYGNKFHPFLLILIHNLQMMAFVIGPNGNLSRFFELFIWKFEYLSLGGDCPFRVDALTKILLPLAQIFLALMFYGQAVFVGWFHCRETLKHHKFTLHVDDDSFELFFEASGYSEASMALGEDLVLARLIAGIDDSNNTYSMSEDTRRELQRIRMAVISGRANVNEVIADYRQFRLSGQSMFDDASFDETQFPAGSGSGTTGDVSKTEVSKTEVSKTEVSKTEMSRTEFTNKTDYFTFDEQEEVSMDVNDNVRMRRLRRASVSGAGVGGFTTSNSSTSVDDSDYAIAYTRASSYTTSSTTAAITTASSAEVSEQQESIVSVMASSSTSWAPSSSSSSSSSSLASFVEASEQEEADDDNLPPAPAADGAPVPTGDPKDPKSYADVPTLGSLTATGQVAPQTIRKEAKAASALGDEVVVKGKSAAPSIAGTSRTSSISGVTQAGASTSAGVSAGVSGDLTGSNGVSGSATATSKIFVSDLLEAGASGAGSIHSSWEGFAGRSDPDEELSEKELQKLRLPNRVVHGFLNLVHTMVVALVAVFMETIVCRNIDGTEVLMVAPSVPCQRDRPLLWAAGIFGVISAIAFPIVWIWVRRRDMRRYEASFPKDRAVDMRHIFVDFRYRRYMFPAILVMEKMAIVVISTVNYSDQLLKTQATFVLMMILLAMRFFFQPYMHSKHNVLSVLSTFSLVVQAYLQYYAQVFSSLPAIHSKLQLVLAWTGTALVLSSLLYSSVKRWVREAKMEHREDKRRMAAFRHRIAHMLGFHSAEHKTEDFSMGFEFSDELENILEGNSYVMDTFGNDNVPDLGLGASSLGDTRTSSTAGLSSSTAATTTADTSASGSYYSYYYSGTETSGASGASSASS